jgi:hypothetical protein
MLPCQQCPHLVSYVLLGSTSIVYTGAGGLRSSQARLQTHLQPANQLVLPVSSLISTLRPATTGNIAACNMTLLVYNVARH